MSWVRRAMTLLGLVRPAHEVRAAARAERILRKADRILEDYKRQDATLRLIVVKRR
jgi:hypothetical protein